MAEKKGYIFSFYLATVCTYIIIFAATGIGFGIMVSSIPFLKLNVQSVHIILISSIFTLYRLINDLTWLRQRYEKVKYGLEEEVC